MLPTYSMDNWTYIQFPCRYVCIVTPMDGWSRIFSQILTSGWRFNSMLPYDVSDIPSTNQTKLMFIYTNIAWSLCNFITILLIPWTCIFILNHDNVCFLMTKQSAIYLTYALHIGGFEGLSVNWGLTGHIQYGDVWWGWPNGQCCGVLQLAEEWKLPSWPHRTKIHCKIFKYTYI